MAVPEPQKLNPAVEKLLKSDKDSFLAGAAIVLKFGNNILNEPNEPKYRIIKLGDKQVKINGESHIFFSKILLTFHDFQCITSYLYSSFSLNMCMYVEV